MTFEDFKKKDAVVVVYTGEGKGKTSASMGLMTRALGSGWRVAFIQFIKHWDVGEHHFIRKIQPLFKKELYFFKGGKGFYKAPEDLVEKDVTEDDHKRAARQTFDEAYKAAASGNFELVICDEINNAVNNGLLAKKDLKKLMSDHHPKTSLCITGRNFPEELLPLADIATNMTKIKHHFDDKYLANSGIDY